MSTYVPEFQSFSGLSHHFVLVKFTTTSITVESLTLKSVWKLSSEFLILLTLFRYYFRIKYDFTKKMKEICRQHP